MMEGNAQRDVLRRLMSHALDWDWKSGLPHFLTLPLPMSPACRQLELGRLQQDPFFPPQIFVYVQQVPGTENVEYSHIPSIAAAKSK